MQIGEKGASTPVGDQQGAVEGIQEAGDELKSRLSARRLLHGRAFGHFSSLEVNPGLRPTPRTSLWR